MTHGDIVSSWDEDTVSHWGDDTVSHTDVVQRHISDVAFDGGIERTVCDNWESCSTDEVNTAANLKKRTVDDSLNAIYMYKHYDNIDDKCQR